MADPTIDPVFEYTPSEATRTTYVTLSDATLTAMGYTPAPGKEKQAIIAYTIPAVTSGGTGQLINIGDGVTGDLATVFDLTNSNPLAIVSVDSDGNIITGNISEVIAVPNDVASSKVMQIGGIAESTTPTEVADGDAVALWMDTFGRFISKSYNFSEGSDNVVIQNQAILNRMGPITNLSAVTGTGAGATINVSNYHNFTIQIVASSVTNGGTMLVQHSLDGTNWRTIDTHTITANGVYSTTISNAAFLYLRTNLSVRTDGTYTTLVYCGN